MAVGECGLDYSYKNSVARAKQVKVFARQVELAMKYDLGIVLHVREAEREAREAAEAEARAAEAAEAEADKAVRQAKAAEKAKAAQQAVAEGLPIVEEEDEDDDDDALEVI